MPEQKQKPRPLMPRPQPGDGEGPSNPKVEKPPGVDDLIKRMRKVDPDTAKNYRQRSGQ